MNQKAFFAIIILITVYSCGIISPKKPSASFKNKIANDSKEVYDKLRFEGAYHFIKTPSYALEGPVYFFSNGFFYADHGSGRTIEEYKGGIYKYFNSKDNWGAFEIIGDTIKVCTYYRYFDSMVKDIETNFQGIIKNKDTIINWQMVPPYPKLNKSLKKDYNFLFKMNDTLVFKYLTFKSYMDSVSEKAWIRKYK